MRRNDRKPDCGLTKNKGDETTPPAGKDSGNRHSQEVERKWGAVANERDKGRAKRDEDQRNGNADCQLDEERRYLAGKTLREPGSQDLLDASPPLEGQPKPLRVTDYITDAAIARLPE
jgi:hypothetical protein